MWSTYSDNPRRDMRRCCPLPFCLLLCPSVSPEYAAVRHRLPLFNRDRRTLFILKVTRSLLYSPLLLLSPHLASSQFRGVQGGRRMAMPKFFPLLLLSLIAISMVQELAMASHGHGGHHYNSKRLYGPGSLKSFQCPSQCTRRCSRTQYHKPCMFFCQKCCSKCLCVPPGYYGNKAICPCYNNWKTKEGGPKCP